MKKLLPEDLDPNRTPYARPTLKDPASKAQQIVSRVVQKTMLLSGMLIVCSMICVGLAIGFVNTGFGRHVVVHEVSRLTGDTVRIDGLSGRFPTKIALSSLQMRDGKGAWVTAHQVVLRWRPSALLHRRIDIETLSARDLSYDRPSETITAPETPGAASAAPSALLGFRLRLRQLNLERVALGGAVVGQPMVWHAFGAIDLADLRHVLNGVDLHHLPVGRFDLALRRQDKDGHVILKFKRATSGVDVHLDAADPSNSFLNAILTRPRAASIATVINASGPDNAIAVNVDMRVNDDKLKGTGLVDLKNESLDLSVSAHTRQIEIANAFGWARLRGSAHLNGVWNAPLGDGAFVLNDINAQGARVGQLDLKFAGEGSKQGAKNLEIYARATRLVANGLIGDPLATSPLSVHVRYRPDEPESPLALSVKHALFDINVDAHTRKHVAGTIRYAFHDLTPWGRIAGVPLKGSAAGTSRVAFLSDQPSQLQVDGKINVALSQVASRWGQLFTGRSLLTFSAMKKTAPSGEIFDLKNVVYQGEHITLDGHGCVSSMPDQPLQGSLKIQIPNLANLDPTLKGAATLNAEATGRVPSFQLDAKLNALLGINASQPGPLDVRVKLRGLPTRAEGSVTADGIIDGSSLALRSRLSRGSDDGFRLQLENLSWHGVDGHADLQLPAGKKFPIGEAWVNVADLDRFSALAGQKLGGHMALRVTTLEAQNARAQRVISRLDGRISTPRAKIADIALRASVDDPLNHPRIDATLSAEGISAEALRGQFSTEILGPEDALTLKLTSQFDQFYGASLKFVSNTVANLKQRTAVTTKLTAQVKDVSLQSRTPVYVRWGDRTEVKNLSLSLSRPGMPSATLEGHAIIKPNISAQVALKNFKPALLASIAPQMAFAGKLDATADLSGTVSAPRGVMTAKVRNFKALHGSAASLPPAALDARADITQNAAAVSFLAQAGPRLRLSLKGLVPLSPSAPLKVVSAGHADLTYLNAVTGASGVSVKGRLQTTLGVYGTLASPKLSGRLNLAEIAVRDDAHGVRVEKINGTIVGASDQLLLQGISGRAGAGDVGMSGTIGVLRKNIPLDVAFQAKNARLLSSDLITAVLDAALQLKGDVGSALSVVGKVKLDAVDINIPDAMPVAVPKLDVVWPNHVETMSAPTHTTNPLALNILVTSPGAFYVRGHGLDAEMQGAVRIKGFANSPSVLGHFDMRRGDFSLAGVNLNFTQGVIGFDGTSVAHQLNPSLDFRADRNVQGTIASLTVTGYASAPKINFTSAPAFPQDQVLAMLLFGSMTPQLTTSQMASIAAALAQLAGKSGGFDPLTKVRNALGLDRLSVGGDASFKGAQVEAGKYVAKGVYVGAKQATSGAGTQAQVQVDLTKRLKLNTTVGTGGQVTGVTTPENDPGSSIGVSYGLDY